MSKTELTPQQKGLLEELHLAVEDIIAYDCVNLPDDVNKAIAGKLNEVLSIIEEVVS